MNKDPAFLFYTSDFIVGTWTMSFEDRGKYITLLACMHQKGHLAWEDMETILRGPVPADLRPKFKKDENGLWYNERLEEEIAKRKRFMESRTANGMLGGRPKKKTGKIKPFTAEMSDASFERFWKMYDKPTEKQSCKLKWNNLPESEKEMILQRLPAYVAATPERQFRKNPLTYLNRKIWQDELAPEIPKAFKKSAFEMLVETGKYE